MSRHGSLSALESMVRFLVQKLQINSLKKIIFWGEWEEAAEGGGEFITHEFIYHSSFDYLKKFTSVFSKLALHN